MQAAGFEVSICPTVTIKPLALTAAARQCLLSLDELDLVLFVSVNAVACTVGWMQELGLSWPISLPVFALGAATENALLQHGIRVQESSQQPYNSESLLKLAALQGLHTAKIVICRGRGGRELLARELRIRGAEVNYLESYERNLPALTKSQYESSLFLARPQYIILSSMAVAKNFFSLCRQAARKYLDSPILVVYSDQQAAYCRGQCDWQTVILQEISDQGVLDSMQFQP